MNCSYGTWKPKFVGNSERETRILKHLGETSGNREIRSFHNKVSIGAGFAARFGPK